MTEPSEPVLSQQPEGLAARVIWLVATGVIAISAVLVTIAWYLVVPPLATERPAATSSTLEHGLFDAPAPGGVLRAAGERRLTRYEWVDRNAHVARIPIDQAIEAVIADPHLIDARSRAMVGAGAATVGQAAGADNAQSSVPASFGDSAAGNAP